MKVERVGVEIGRLVGAAEAEEIRTDHPRAGGGEMRDHLAIEKGPARLAVQAQEGAFRIRRTGVDPGGAQPFIAGQVFGIGNREIKIGQIVEACLGRADGDDGHGRFLSIGPSTAVMMAGTGQGQMAQTGRSHLAAA